MLLMGGQPELKGKIPQHTQSEVAARSTSTQVQKKKKRGGSGGGKKQNWARLKINGRNPRRPKI